MPTVKEVETALFDWAPKELAATWDNVGHLVGDPEQEIRRVVIALDITQQVVQETFNRGAQLVVSHHPLMNCAWHPVQNILCDTPQGKLLSMLIENHISAICMHTNLDAAKGGVNDCLAAALGLQDTELLDEASGIGRVGTLSCEKKLEEFLPDVVQSLKCSGLRYRKGSKDVYRVAVGGGACGDMLPLAKAKGCDTFVTSDLRYHDFTDSMGLNLIDAGHFATENVVCPAIGRYLKTRFPSIDVILSTSHRDVIEYYYR